MLFFLLPIFCLAKQECVVNGTDYSSVTRKDNFFKIETQFYIFEFNVCGPVNDDDDIAIGRKKGNENYVSLGKYSTQQPVEDDFGVGFKYTGGGKEDGKQWSSTLYIKCDKTVEKDTVKVATSNLDELSVSFIMQGPGLCPVEKQGLSGGQIFGILVLIVVIVVLALWLSVLIFNVVKGKRGLAMLPITGLFQKDNSGYNEFN